MYTRSWSAQILQIDRSAIWAIINDFHFFTYIINLMLILNEIKLRAYITGHRNDVFFLGWLRKRPYSGAQLQPLSLCGLQTAPRHILNAHEHFHARFLLLLCSNLPYFRAGSRPRALKQAAHFHKRGGLNTRAWCFSLLSCNCQWLRIFWLSRK